jgi:hypothetical protein
MVGWESQPQPPWPSKSYVLYIDVSLENSHPKASIFICKSCNELLMVGGVCWWWLLGSPANVLNLHNTSLVHRSLEPYGTDIFRVNLTPCCHVSLSYTTCWHSNKSPKHSNHSCVMLSSLWILWLMQCWIEINHERIQTILLHASCCHHCDYCNVDFEVNHQRIQITLLHALCYHDCD